LRSPLESLDLGLDGRGALRVLLLDLVQCSLRLVDRPLAAFTVLLRGGLFARPFALMPLLLLFESDIGLSLGHLVRGARAVPSYKLTGGTD